MSSHCWWNKVQKSSSWFCLYPFWLNMLPTWVRKSILLSLTSLSSTLPPPSRIGCLAQTIFWSVNQKWLWIYKNKCNNRPEKSLTVSSKFKQLLRTCMNWYGCFILKGILIFCITIHHSKETLCVIHKLIWEQNCQGQESSTSPYLYSRPRREHHCNLLIRCWMEKET